MKSNKIIKWLYGLFMFVPFLAIGVKSMYVTFNKNAKDSYYGDTINQEIKNYFDINNIEINENYFLQAPIITTFETHATDSYIQVSNFTYNNTTYNEVNRLRFYYTTQYASLFAMNDTNQISGLSFDLRNNTYLLQFTIEGFGNQSNFSALGNNFYQIEYNKYSYLDNAFYYAIDEFNSVGFDKINFVSWFDFLYESTNVYTTFINCYVNYMLFVSLAFFIPRVLYWFINFAYSLTDSFSGKSNGGGW